MQTVEEVEKFRTEIPKYSSFYIDRTKRNKAHNFIFEYVPLRRDGVRYSILAIRSCDMRHDSSEKGACPLAFSTKQLS